MKQHDLEKKAAEILRSNIYLTLATTDGQLPWAAPVFYCLDKHFHFYFISQLDSLHITHILQNPTVAFAIFDSHQPEGEGNGIQGFGTVVLLEKEGILRGLKYYSSKFIELKPENLSNPAPYRLFKIIPKKIYMLDPEAKTDKRVEVQINHYLRS